MDTIHDMGGMHGFGPVDTTTGPGRHDAWEERVLGIRVAMNLAGQGGGELRPHIEAIPAAVYLSSGYYERWARGLASIVVASGLLTASEIEARASAFGSGDREAPAPVQVTAETHTAVAARMRAVANPGAAVRSRFHVGDRARVRRMAPAGHTRCPRYVRGVAGTVVRITGGFMRPDEGEHPVEQTYTVEFDRRHVWGEDAEPGPLCVDLWEGYLE